MRTTLIAAREPWRAHSIISPALRGTLQGLGWRSYTDAQSSTRPVMRRR